MIVQIHAVHIAIVVAPQYHKRIGGVVVPRKVETQGLGKQLALLTRGTRVEGGKNRGGFRLAFFVRPRLVHQRLS